jgi:hypothetical protein
VVVLLAVLVALAVAAALLSGGSGSPSGRPTTPPTSTSPPTTVPSALSVAEATSALQGLLAEGVADGDITSHAADEIGHGVDDATKQFGDGHVDKAVEKLDHLPDKVSEFEDKGEISNGFADQLDQAIADLADAMQA